MMKAGDTCPHCGEGKLGECFGFYDHYLMCDSCDSTYLVDFEESEPLSRKEDL